MDSSSLLLLVSFKLGHINKYLLHSNFFFLFFFKAANRVTATALLKSNRHLKKTFFTFRMFKRLTVDKSNFVCLTN